MKNTIFKRVIMIPMSILIIIGVALMGLILDGYNKVNSITFYLESGDQEIVEFEHIGLVPGGSCEYKIKIKGKDDFVMNLSLNDIETEDKNDLEKYAFVKIISNGEVILDELLVDAFEHEELVLPVQISKGINTELEIIYYLPIEVGNEAKNATADFELLVRASEE